MKSNENKYVCDNCNNEYKTYQSLRNHKNKYHLKNEEVINKNLICKYCNKIFSYRNSRWVHEKACKQNTQVKNYQYNKNINIQNNNNNTKTPELFQKKYYFDELIKKVNDRIKQLYKNYINDTFVTENKDKIKNMLYSNQNFVEKFYGDKILNSLIKEIEALTYNYRQTVIDTWNGKNNNYLLIRKINKLIKKIELNKLPYYESYEYYKYHLIIENLFKKLEKQIIK